MVAADKVFSLLKLNKGYLTSREAKENGVDNKILQRMTERGLIERAAHGLYIGTDIFPDSLYVAQYRCPKGVFSYETALFLHNLCDRYPFRFTMTIPSGWNTPMLTDDNFIFFYSRPEWMGLGVCETVTPSGVNVKAYDIERTLCDCLRNADKIDRDLAVTGLKRYVKSTGKDNAKLLKYATALNIRDVMFRYLEVLS